MSEAKTGFMDKPIYPILFMLVLTVIFVGLLSVFYRSTEKGIEIYKKQTYQLNVLSLFADTLSSISGINKTKLLDLKQVETNYPKYIRDMQLPKAAGTTIKQTYFAVSTVPDNILGYCFDVTGSGLWGTMHGLLAVTPDFSHIINFAIYDQMETPGLGARVGEPWFKQQFAGKPLIYNKHISQFVLVPEETPATDMQVKQITGASITSSSVLKILAAVAAELNTVFNLKSGK